MSNATSNSKKLSVDEFVYLAILRLRTGDCKAIHTVYSGFNSAFREYFAAEKLDPIREVDRMVNEGKLIRRPVKGGCSFPTTPTSAVATVSQ